MEPIVISLGKPAQVLVGAREVKCPLKKDLLLHFRRMPRGKFRLKIEPVSYGPLKIKDETKLLLLQYNGKTGSSIEAEPQGASNSYNIFLDTTQISDCDALERKERHERSIRIEYQITVFVKDKPCDGTVTGAFEVEIAPLDYDLNVSLKAPETELVYATGQGETPAGSLCFSHGSEFNYAAPLRVDFKYELRHHGEVVREKLLRLDSAAIESIPLSGTRGSDINLGTGTVLEYSQKRNEIRNLYPNHTAGGNNVVSIPLYMDLSKITNPIDDEDEKYVLSVSGTYSAVDVSDSSVIMTKSFSKDMTVRVKRNTRFTELKVFLEKQGARIRVRDFGHNKVNVLPLAETLCAAEGLKVSYRIRLGNMAQAIDPEHPAARVLISNFSCEVVQTGDARIELKENSSIEDVFRMSGTLLDVRNTRALDCGSPKLEMNFDYDPAGIRKISNGYECPVDIRFSFNYAIDLDGILDAPVESYTGVIRTKVELVPSPEWLCVDFGTSAVVASYGDKLTDNRGERMDILLDLKTAKKNLLRKAYPKDSLKQKDESESAPKLISSQMALNPDNEGDYDELKAAKEFGQSALLFSPASGMLVSNDYMLPCLKSMVGFRSLPAALVTAISDVRFNYRKGGDTIEFNSYNSPLTRVDTLFEIVYKQLFHLYLEKASTAQKRTDCGNAQRLILTYPNTYTPLHLKKVREIAAKQLPDLRIDDSDESRNYLRFISESDAVAFYYLSRRSALKSGHDLPDDFDRNILVYDMGAGTLDLTYIVKTSENAETLIDIRGKMGVNKAGNYVDYVLGEILCGLATSDNDKNLLREALGLGAGGANSNSVAFKRYIKSVLKPALNKDDEEKIPEMSLGAENAATIKFDGTIGDIINDKRYRQYLLSATKKVFENFAGIMGSMGFRTEENKINIVVFSGRASGLRGLRAAVKENLEPYMKEDCRFFDISGDDFIEPDERIRPDAAAISRLKTVVVDGAMTYATLYGNEGSMYKLKKRNVYSIYGLILERGNSDSIEWRPLITPLSKPLSDKPEEHFGMTVYQYDSAECSGGNMLMPNLGSYSKMYLVSSYCADTAAAWKSRDMEMISVLAEINLGALGSQNLGNQPVVLKINGQNELQLCIGDLNQTFSPHEDWGDETFLKSLWPVKLAK